jgi:hypothetical protein
VRPNELIEGTLGFFEDRPGSGQLYLLLEKADPGSGMEPDFTIVRRIETGEYFEERGFARAVWTHQAHALPGTQLEADVYKHGRIERSRQFSTAKKQHCVKPKPLS